MLKAVIMDFDGVIVDTEVVWYNIFIEWFQKNWNYDLSIEEFLTCVGSHSEDLFNKLETDYNIVVDRKQFGEETSQRFLEESKDLPLKEGVLEFIQGLKKDNILLALATSATRKKPMYHLTRLNILPYFDVIVTSEDVEKIKPNPDLFNKAVEKLEIQKEEAVIIEDSENGLIAGNRADIRTIVCPNDVTKYSKFENYFMKVDSLKEVGLDNLMKIFNESSEYYAIK